MCIFIAPDFKYKSVQQVLIEFIQALNHIRNNIN